MNLKFKPLKKSKEALFKYKVNKKMAEIIRQQEMQAKVIANQENTLLIIKVTIVVYLILRVLTYLT